MEFNLMTCTIITPIATIYFANSLIYVNSYIEFPSRVLNYELSRTHSYKRIIVFLQVF